MAQNVKINGVTYSDVPQVTIPKSAGSGNATFYDTAGADVSASDVRSGKKFYGSTGQDTGTLAEVSCISTSIATKSASIPVPAGIHAGGQSIAISSTEQAKIIASNIKKGVTILGVEGGLSSATVSQDGSTKVLTIS